MKCVQNLENTAKPTFFWISHPEISLNAYFQLYNSIALLDVEFQPHFPCV